MSELIQRDARVHPVNNFRRLWLGVVVSSTVALTACGGGGGSTDDTQAIVGGQTPIEVTPVEQYPAPENDAGTPSDGTTAPKPAPEQNESNTGSSTPQTQGSAKLSWVPPAERVDGEALALNEIGGYRIYYGTVANPSSTVVEIDDASVTSYTINGLSAASYSFSITAFDSDGRESALSNSLSKTVN